MASANAQIGVAYAAFYPNLTLTADGGFESSAFISSLLAKPLLVDRCIVPETIFDAGLRRATVKQYTATYNADLAGYRADCTYSLSTGRRFSRGSSHPLSRIQQEQEAVNSAQTYLKLEQARYETGIDPYVDVLIAQTTLLNDQQTLNNLQVEEMTSAVAFKRSTGRRMG